MNSMEKKIIGHFKMIEIDEALTKKEITEMLDSFPDVKLIPMANVMNKELNSNSVAMGFVLDEPEHLEKIYEKITDICNDWSLETRDRRYDIGDGFILVESEPSYAETHGSNDDDSKLVIDI